MPSLVAVLLNALLAFELVFGSVHEAGPAPLPSSLRDTGLYADWESKRVDAQNLPFSPQYPLWSDGADKRRWIFLPPGKWIEGSSPDRWSFPVGTRFWKEFSFSGRRVETRLILRTEQGWQFGAYAWKEDGSEAELVPDGATDHFEFEEGLRHDIPSLVDCNSCHQEHPAVVLGFSALQLSPDRDPLAPGAEPKTSGMVDLKGLVDLGLLRRYPPALLDPPPRIAASSPTARAALGYLHGNCGNCHNGKGALGVVDLSFWHGPGVRLESASPSHRTAIDRLGKWSLPGSSEEMALIRPGEPDRSSVYLRMNSREPSMQMPPVASKKIDRRAVSLLRQWIQELQNNPKQRRSK
jgi:hypothetical protein